MTYIHTLHTNVKQHAAEEHPLAVVVTLFGQNEHNNNGVLSALGHEQLKSVNMWGIKTIVC